MSGNYFPEYVFPMVDKELLNREPDERDNPYFLLEHILACREQGLDSEEWHDTYIDKALLGALKNDVDTELDVYHGTGKDGDRYRWREHHRMVDVILDAYRQYKNGNEFEDDPEYMSLNLKGVRGIYEVVSIIHGIKAGTVKNIFDISKLPPKRTPLEKRKKHR